MIGKKNQWMLLSLGLASLSLTSCGGSSSTAANSGFAEAVVGSPFVSTSGSTSIDVTRSFTATAYTTRRAQIQTLLNATDVNDCNFDIDLVQGSGQAPCYSPNVDITGSDHPDSGVAVPGGTQLLFGDGGIWDSVDDTSGDACTAAQINALDEVHAGESHFANMLGAATKCFISNTSGLSFPGPGSSLTLDGTTNTTERDAFQTILNNGGSDTFGITSIVVTGVRDASDTSIKGYRYEIEGSWTDVKDDLSSNEYEMTVKAQHLAGSGGVLKGSLAYRLTDPDQFAAGNCSDAGISQNETTYAGDLIYNRVSSTETQVVLNHTSFCGDASPLGSAAENFVIDPCDAVSASNVHGWGNNFNHVVMDFDPSTLDGTFVFVWQAGKGDRAGRTFNATLSTAGTTRTGSGFFGYGSHIRDSQSACTGYATDLGVIDGFICNWSGPGHHGDGTEYQDYVQNQVMTLDTATAGAHWMVSTESIRYAPVNACSFNAGSNDLDYIRLLLI